MNCIPILLILQAVKQNIDGWSSPLVQHLNRRRIKFRFKFGLEIPNMHDVLERTELWLLWYFFK